MLKPNSSFGTLNFSKIRRLNLCPPGMQRASGNAVSPDPDVLDQTGRRNFTTLSLKKCTLRLWRL